MEAPKHKRAPLEAASISGPLEGWVGFGPTTPGLREWALAETARWNGCSTENAGGSRMA